MGIGPDHPQGVTFSELLDGKPARPVLEAYSTVTGPLPASGRPHDQIYMQRNPDYPDDTDLCFEVGNSETRVRLTPADQEKLWAVLGLLPVRATAGMVREFLAGMLEETYRAEQLADGEIGPGPAARALERVIAMLEQS